MKQIKLLNLKLVNFKGIQDLDIDFNGSDARVFGENGTGKTTVFDAFVWLLFDKDSSNNSAGRMGIKTLDSDGNVIHHLDHTVEATLLVDDTEMELKKVYKEQWTRHRGSISEKFNGHTTDHYINGVPSKKKEYDETIESIVSEDVFQLLTNPSYFNEVLHWKKRRDLLFEVAGDLTEKEIIESHDELKDLLDVLNGNSVEDHKAIVAAKLKEINKQIDEIPTRIDEINRNMPDITGLNEVNINKEIETLNKKVNDKSEQINSIKNGSEVNELKKQISDIDLKIANVRNEHTQNEQNELHKLKLRLQEEGSNHEILQGDVRGFMQQKKINDNDIEEFERQMDLLRNEYKQLQEDHAEWIDREFEHNDDDCVCPTCKQDLPVEKIDEAIAEFNKNKADTLEKIKSRQEEINEEGITLKNKVESLQNKNESVKGEIERITTIGKKKVEEIELLKKKIERAESQVTPVEKNEQYIKLNEEKQSLENRIKELEQSVESSVREVNKEIEELKDNQRSSQADLAKIEQSKQSEQRIKELENEERELAAAYEKHNKELFLTEEFTRRKVEMLTENINNKFKHARFNLFRELISNDGLEEICETTYNGVPYGAGLNNAAKINVGLDIINTLSKHYGVQAPIFVDNAESVTKLIDVDAQVISLVVSEPDKELRIEADEDKESEVA